MGLQESYSCVSPARVPSRASTWGPDWLRQLEEAPPAASGEAPGQTGPDTANTPPAEARPRAWGCGGGWDQAEVDCLLAEVHAGLARLERDQYGGRFPPVIRSVVDTCLRCMTGYIATRDLELLRSAPDFVLRVARGDYYHHREAS